MKYCSAFLLSFFLVYPVHTQHNNPLYASNSADQKTVHWLFNDTNIYDISGSWSHLTPMPDSLFCVNSYYWSFNDKVFICGGAKYPLAPQAKCRWYSVNSNQYESAADLPHGRWSGKLVRVRDSLFLIGSIDSTFNSADGLIFRYSLNQNSWVISDTMPAPLVHECAVSVINDSLILTIGGSTNAFLSPTNIVRIYNPWNRTWKVTTPYPVNVTSAHSDYLGDDSIVVVLGGYNAGNLNVVYRGFIDYLPGDTVQITWAQFGASGLTPFGLGVYRVAGARWNDYVLFGPALNDVNTVNQIWGLKTNGDTTWLNFTPRSLDSAGNISTYGVKSGPDSNYFFLFGGFKNPVVLSLAQKFTFATPPPIGVPVISNQIPGSFKLHQNYPNPFNPVTKIRFDVPKDRLNELSIISLKVYDVLGRVVGTIFEGSLRPGTYEFDFDGRQLSSGVYFYVLHSSEVSIASKMILNK